MLSPVLSYKPQQLVYVFNRCNHTYGLVVEDGHLIASGGL
jgi:hypothetical protein